MRIAFIGQSRGTSLHRSRALERLGHDVHVIDPWSWLKNSKWVGAWIYRTGAMGIGVYINQRSLTYIRAIQPEFILVDQGEFLNKALLRKLLKLNVPIVNYIIDDPFGGRDGLRFRSFLKAIACYDLIVLVREPNAAEAQARGARNVLKVWMSADEVAHTPRVLSEDQGSQHASEVVFWGTWMPEPERWPFMAELIQRDVPLYRFGATVAGIR